MARKESSRAPIVPPTMRTARVVNAAPPPVAKSYVLSAEVEVSPAAASVPKPSAQVAPTLSSEPEAPADCDDAG